MTYKEQHINIIDGHLINTNVHAKLVKSSLNSGSSREQQNVKDGRKDARTERRTM